MDINDLIYAYRQFEQIEKDVRKSKEDIDYKLCLETYGYGKEDWIPLNDEFIQKQLQNSNDSFFSEDVKNSTMGKIDYIGFYSNYVKLNVGGWVVETNKETLQKFGLIK